MNSVRKLLLVAITSGCVGKPNLDTQRVVIHTHQVHPQVTLQETDTLKLNLQNSKLSWKGTKMRGAGKHEGEIRISQGFLLSDGEGMTGGMFEVDMNSISISDIPKTDPIPIKNLTEHLMHEDFFDVDNFPTATFEITRIDRFPAGNLEISGALSIRGITKNVTFSAVSSGNIITANFLLNRFDWNIAYQGSWADRTLVDRDIKFRIELVLSNDKITEIM